MFHIYLAQIVMADYPKKSAKPYLQNMNYLFQKKSNPMK
ncbi:hypothetical protein N478_01450 [Pseudoalteromonas luteoviolacea S4060-1]|uniref:Uncharacterized protein n=1 Tax=Pseudoalteromonas luteoviolacea S4060-1 TaxID=1365257 RepID=A0A162CG72_9GAMM|nr:hypothetical protein N478_01450 [Pseudoalteromonas luteoviolacea S4060-1]